MNYETNKLKTRIIEKFGSYAAFAEKLGMEKSTLSKLINEGREWKGSTMMKAVELLEIPATEIESYFFTPAVGELQPSKT